MFIYYLEPSDITIRQHRGYSPAHGICDMTETEDLLISSVVVVVIPVCISLKLSNYKINPKLIPKLVDIIIKLQLLYLESLDK